MLKAIVASKLNYKTKKSSTQNTADHTKLPLLPVERIQKFFSRKGEVYILCTVILQIHHTNIASVPQTDFSYHL